MTYIEIYNLLDSKYPFDENTKVTDSSDRYKVQKMIEFNNSKRQLIIDETSELHCSPNITLYEWCLKQDLINK